MYADHEQKDSYMQVIDGGTIKIFRSMQKYQHYAVCFGDYIYASVHWKTSIIAPQLLNSGCIHLNNYRYHEKNHSYQTVCYVICIILFNLAVMFAV